ncbi:MAG: sugar phosphate isomerase/epimerase [Treponema sp.]|jgi:D-psicose/D-tagatose/L-ribulose 3-epimerase|nr:sugar phosphate isomerase/epimerase [Treponema sp.]
MQYGIYYAYWERQWGGDYPKYAQKVGKLGFDILEISCASLPGMKKEEIRELKAAAKDAGIALSAGYGPRSEENLSSADSKIVEQGFEFWKKTFEVLHELEITVVGGGLYSYWPVDFSKPFNKEEDLKRSIESMRRLAEMASGITLGMEALNRFEGYLINTAAEARSYVEAVGCKNVKAMLDTFHMNIEEDSLTEAIKTAGPCLGHFHIGEANRRPPRPGTRMDWKAIGKTLRDTGYTGAVVMEPFVLMGGQVGRDIKVWRDVSGGAGEAELDEAARASVEYIRAVFGGTT